MFLDQFEFYSYQNKHQGAVMQLTIPANPNSSDIHYDWLLFRKQAQPYLRIDKDLSLMGPIVTILRVYSGKKRTTLLMKRQIRHLNSLANIHRTAINFFGFNLASFALNLRHQKFKNYSKTMLASIKDAIVQQTLVQFLLGILVGLRGGSSGSRRTFRRRVGVGRRRLGVGRLVAPLRRKMIGVIDGRLRKIMTAAV